MAILYGGNSKEQRYIIYVEINNARATLYLPFLIMGDFNDELNYSERKGQPR